LQLRLPEAATEWKMKTQKTGRKRARTKQQPRSAERGRATRPKSTKRSAPDQLTEYRRKRNFRKTAEPAGADAPPAATRRSAPDAELQFVIQKHAASQLHYDFRLEVDDVMKSWAVPKGPSLDPKVKRLAMQVEDHPIEYNTFEGTIPQGEYGGGTVMLWDRGTYAPDEMEPNETPAAAVRRGLRAGKLALTLYGERLRGSFALVRTHAQPRPKWLLIKHRDDEATASFDITAAVRTSVATGRTMEEIAGEGGPVWRSNRGGRKGGEERVPIAGAPDGVTPMRPKPARTLPEGDDWTFEPWYGGERVLAYAAADGARLVDARGRDITRRYRPLAAELTTLAERTGRRFVVDAELAGTGDAAQLHVSDLLVDGDRTLLEEPWRARRAALELLLGRRRLQRIHRQSTRSTGPALLRRAARDGWAGVLARHLHASYRPGARDDTLLRIATR
jgi:bifunctional non-homologous end joining protein LigD